MSGLDTMPVKHSYKHARGDRPIEDFLIPALSLSVLYQRAAGYFNSTVLSQLAPGIVKLVENGGKVQLLTSHELSAKDLTALEASEEDPENWKQLVEDFNTSFDLISEIEQHNVRAMLWMLEKKYLEIKVVVPRKRLLGESAFDISMYHPKFGIFTDSNGRQIAFAGSLNETVNGWFYNIENMNVFTDRNGTQKQYLSDFQEEFDRYWAGDAGSGWAVLSLPEAVAKKIISANGAEEPGPRTGLPPAKPGQQNTRRPRAYQQEAIDEWMHAGRVGLLRMATGTGKTFTAKQCIARCREDAESLLTVLIAPYQHIADQWAEELDEFLPLDLSNTPGWRKVLQGISADVVLGRETHVTVIAVKNTAGTDDFENIIGKLAPNFEHFLLVADEVHWMGASAYRKGLSDLADWRLGLSATPVRYFDDEGSDFLEEYFKSEERDQATVYDFPLSKALDYIDEETGKPILAPYRYLLRFVELTEEEQESYQSYTRTIGMYSNRRLTEEEARKLQNARNQRAMILKKAANKIPALKELVSELGLDGFNFSLIYCSESSQMEEAGKVLTDAGLDFQRITSAESARASKKRRGKSEREEIIESFAKGRVQTLLSIDCLDEGVDIPAARAGFILASSGNPKEFIQRRGRLMRQHPGKEKADIYDFVAVPFAGLNNDEIFLNELARIQEFATDALNKEEIIELLYSKFGVERPESGVSFD